MTMGGLCGDRESVDWFCKGNHRVLQLCGGGLEGDSICPPSNLPMALERMSIIIIFKQSCLPFKCCSLQLLVQLQYINCYKLTISIICSCNSAAFKGSCFNAIYKGGS